MSSNRVTMIRVLAIGVLFLPAISWAQNRPPILEQIAKTYGLDSFGQIDAIRYTWNGEITGLFKLSRTWEWEPKTGKVSYEGKDKDGKPVKVMYLRSELSSQSDIVKNQVDPGFTNDNYWLLFPLHAYWDTSATVTDEGMKKLPVGNGSATLVTVKYAPEVGGYTPGDTWDLYVGKDYRVEYLVFHHGGDKKPSLVKATWAGYKKAGPLLISTEHRGTADGKPLHIFITGVAVKLAGSDAWVEAK
ncbi:MAG: hypothetical protein WBW53_14625 [Terriglobales bacterium]